MGTFNPTITEYDIREGRNINIIVTYLDEYLQSHPVTITPNFINDTISTSSGIIQGYYSKVFSPLVNYRRPDYSYNTTNNIFSVPQDGLPLIYRFIQDGSIEFDYVYTASANNETIQYTVTVINDWNNQQSNLIQTINPELYQQITVRWINNSDAVIPWENDLQDTVNWRTETWPWP